jgi:predicted dehydrogenase
MAMNAKEAEEMLSEAKKSGKKLMIGFVRRFGNDCKVVKDFIDADSLGEIYYAKTTYLRRNGNPGGWFGDKTRSGGGPLIDLGVHVIDLTRYLMGNPKPVSVFGATFNKLGPRADIKGKSGYSSIGARGSKDVCTVEDAVTAIVKYDNGAVLNIEASFSLNVKQDSGKIELFGTKGGASLNPELEIYTDMNGYFVNVDFDMSTALSFQGLFENEVRYFVESVLTDRDLTSIAEDGVTLMKIIDGIYESASTGRSVDI